MRACARDYREFVSFLGQGRFRPRTKGAFRIQYPAANRVYKDILKQARAVYRGMPRKNVRR